MTFLGSVVLVLHHPVSIVIFAIIFPCSQFVCVINITVDGGFWSGLNTFAPTDKSVE